MGIAPAFCPATPGELRLVRLGLRHILLEVIARGYGAVLEGDGGEGLDPGDLLLGHGLALCRVAGREGDDLGAEGGEDIRRVAAGDCAFVVAVLDHRDGLHAVGERDMRLLSDQRLLCCINRPRNGSSRRQHQSPTNNTDHQLVHDHLLCKHVQEPTTSTIGFLFFPRYVIFIDHRPFIHHGPKVTAFLSCHVHFRAESYPHARLHCTAALLPL
ncbi:hypothetical protein [Sphingomonas sp. 2378]|uniref:hypothetical protein n=1 Tax=Sphingomonas sp. 2378 TaxID=1219748 RepID=UPI00311ACC6D